MRFLTLLAALCLVLVLAGCGESTGSTLSLAAERDVSHTCSKSAYVELSNDGPRAGRFAGWTLTDSTGTYDLPALSFVLIYWGSCKNPLCRL